MATATSLTAEAIEGMTGGWVQVGVIQEQQAALLSTFEAILATNTENLQNFEDVVLPAIQQELNNSAIAVDNLMNNEIPSLQVTLSGHNENLEQLNDVIIPDLQAGLNSNFVWIEELNDVTLPQLYSDLAANNAAVEELNNVTLPALNLNLSTLQGKFPIAGPDIQADAITANHIAADAVTANEIAANTITANEIAANTITANEVAAGAITADELAAGSVVAGKVAADAITANEIAAGTITTTELAAGAVTAEKIAANTITANELRANSVTSSELASDSVTANKIAAYTITGDKIAANTISVTRLIVSDLTNLAVDGDLSDPNSTTWFEMGSNSIIRVKNAGEPAYLKNKNSFSATTIFFRNENQFEVKPLDEFYVSMEVSTPASNTSDIEFHPAISVWDRDGVNQLWRDPIEGPVVLPPNTGWQTVTGTISLNEANLAKAQLSPYGKVLTASASGTQEVRVRQLVLRRKSTGSLIVDGSIEGKHIKANSITADEIDTNTLTGDLFVGEVIFGGLMRAGDLDDSGIITGGYSEMGSRGIFTVDDNGDPVFIAPTGSDEGAYLKAHLDLLSADVRDNFTMHGTNNSIATEAELTLSAGVESPSVPPVLQQVWDQVQFDKTTAVPPHTASAGYNLGTFAFNPAQVTSISWNSLWNHYAVVQQRSNGYRVWRFNSNGTIQNNLSTGRPWVDDYNDRYNASACYNTTKNGLAMLFESGGQWYVWDPQYINKIPSSWILDADSRPPTIWHDPVANNYCLVQNNPATNGIQIRRFTVNSGSNFPNASSVSVTNTSSGTRVWRRLNGAVYGDQTGINGWAISSDEYQTVWVFNAAGTPQNGDGYYRYWAKPGAALGFTHNGTEFVSIDASGILTTYTNWTWTGLDATVWIGASAADTDSGGTGLHETPVGTMKSVKLNRRSKLKIVMPETNDSGGADDPDKWRLYFKRGGSVAPTDKNLLKQIGDIGSPTASTSVVISADATGGTPPGGINGQPTAINNFPGADPGRIESSALMPDGFATLVMMGNGAGRWGTLTVDENGKAVIGGDTGWITPTLTNGWVYFGTPYNNAAYRRIGNRVFLRGLVKSGSITAGIFTLPVGFRPPAREIHKGISVSTGVTVNGDGTKSTGGPDDNVTTSTSSHTHGMKNHTHNVSYNLTASSQNVAVRITIQEDGVIACGDATAGNGYISLDGISFLID